MWSAIPARHLPWVDATGGIWLKVLRVDSASGIWVVANRFEPGVTLQTHRHTGPVDGYTVSGRWHYLEYDFYSTAGSYIREPAGSIHTLDVPADNEGITVTRGGGASARSKGYKRVAIRSGKSPFSLVR